MMLEGVNPLEFDTGVLFKRFCHNIGRFDFRRKTLQKIQVENNISGLREGETKIGNGVIAHWEPRRDDFLLTEDDLVILRTEGDRLFQFWADHVGLNKLDVFIRKNEDWLPFALEEIKHHLDSFDWVDIWEDLAFHKTDMSMPVTDLQGRLVGYQYIKSDQPKEGYEKHHEIHLLLGKGKDWENPYDALSVCATNQDYPSS
jgi:hypothetical protein